MSRYIVVLITDNRKKTHHNNLQDCSGDNQWLVGWLGSLRANNVALVCLQLLCEDLLLQELQTIERTNIMATICKVRKYLLVVVGWAL